MGNSTANYGLIKPSEEDYYNVEDFNGNADVIDGELNNLNTKLNRTKYEIGTVTLTNTKQYPFTDSEQTITLATTRDNLDYVVVAEVLSANGSCELQPAYDKQLNAFKLKFLGSATTAYIKYFVQGGLE